MYKTILVPIDLSHPEQGAAMLGKARQLGGGDARIVALYVTADIPGFVASELPDGLLRRTMKKAEGDLKALVADSGAEAQVISGQPATMIIDVADKVGADLIIVASHQPGLQDYFLGSTAARVVRHSPCSVLVDR